jgi:branched-chain amino acid transport system substrate-binding protein
MRAYGILSTVITAMALLPSGEITAQSNQPWLIGIVEPLSGPLATEGSRRDKVNKMWAEQINAQGGIAGRKVELVICNDEGRPEKSVACARDMLDKRVTMIFSNSPTASSRAIQPLVTQGPPLIIPSPNVMPTPDSYGFQISTTTETNNTAIARFLSENGIRKLGMVVATDATGEAEVNAARKVYQAHNIELKIARIDLRATDASTQLATVAGPDVPVVYVSYSGGGAATVVKSFKNLGLRQPMIVSYGNVSNAFVQLINDVLPPRLLAVGVLGLAPELLKDPNQQKKIKDFIEAYNKRYGEPVDQLSLNARAELDVAEAILRNVSNPYDFPAVKKFLETTPINGTRFKGFSPANHIGPGAADIMIVELKNGRWTKADPVRAK